MSTLSIVLAPLVCAAIAVATDPLSYRPAAGLVVERGFESAFEARLDRWSVVMNGSEVPREYLPALSIDLDARSKVSMRDELLAASGGRPSKLRRTYTSAEATEGARVSMNGQADLGSGERSGKTSVGGCVVVFDAAAEDEASRRVLERGECEGEALKHLELDLDYTVLLPASEDVEAWDLPAESFNPFDERLAGVVFEYERSAEDAGAPPEELRANAKGVWKLERLEQREENGLDLHVVRLQGQFETFGTIRKELLHVPVADGEADERTEFELQITGELVWDATHGVLHALELDSAGSMRIHTVRVRDGSGTDAAYEQTMYFDCDTKLRVRTAVEKPSAR